MNGIEIARLCFAIGAVQGLVWTLIFTRMRRRVERMNKRVWRTGEQVVLGPERSYYLGCSRQFGLARTLGTLVLTDRRLLFVRPLGGDIDVPLWEIVEASGTATFRGLQHRFDKYLALKLHDGTDFVFMVSRSEPWIEEVRSRIARV